MNTKNITYVSLSAVVISLCSLVSIPLPIPFTLQTAGVALVLLLFGGKIGSASVAVYLALGACGAPVFSSLGSGLGVLLGPTGGFLFGFLAFALSFWLAEIWLKNIRYVHVVSLSVGLILLYAVGIAWYTVWQTKNGATLGVGSALLYYVVPYALPDVLKLFLAELCSKRLKLILC